MPGSSIYEIDPWLVKTIFIDRHFWKHFIGFQNRINGKIVSGNWFSLDQSQRWHKQREMEEEKDKIS